MAWQLMLLALSQLAMMFSITAKHLTVLLVVGVI
jgi:hypothetical protein